MPKFMRLIAAGLALLVTSMLSACGGAEAQSLPGANTTGIAITKPASVTDGWYGGLNVTRDASALSGGTGVNSALYAHTKAGALETSPEWTGVFQLDNYSNAGGNSALYAWAGRYGNGPTWASVLEARDYGSTPGAVYIGESDLVVTGPDTGMRFGHDVILYDTATAVNPTGVVQPAQTGVAGATFGLRIGPADNCSYCKWTTGIVLRGPMGTALDTSAATTSTSIRLGAGQAISLDGADQLQIKFQGGQFQITNKGVPVFAIDPATGDIYKNGVKVL